MLREVRKINFMSPFMLYMFYWDAIWRKLETMVFHFPSCLMQCQTVPCLDKHEQTEWITISFRFSSHFPPTCKISNLQCRSVAAVCRVEFHKAKVDFTDKTNCSLGESNALKIIKNKNTWSQCQLLYCTVFICIKNLVQ